MSAPPCESRILIGTSGFSFRDWVGPFYPAGTRSGDFLSYYARHFDTVEVNSTYYAIPNPRVMDLMEKKTPPGFRFIVKLNKAMTHDGSLEPGLYREFLAVLSPLKAAGKYDGLLAQFPWGFKHTPRNLAHLEGLRDRLAGEPLFVEFRHDSWLTPDLAAWLRQHELGFCAVDEPPLKGLLPPVTMVTATDAYVRFHGRNSDTWWASGTGGDRYDYDYSPAELAEWVKKVGELARQARRTYLFFNNCHAGQAARNASLMKQLLSQQQPLPG